MKIDSFVSVHDRNLRTLATEMYDIYHGISPTIINEIFTLRHQNQCNLRNWTYFDAPKVRAVNHASIKKWRPESCQCRLCRVYLQNIGYL